jgi:pyruvate dehydrogenase E2 component (dihydrolipoamide acetyltransferase)
LRRSYLIVEIVIPNLGATGGDVIIQDFLIKPGDFVQAGAPLFIVITDKATVEIEAYRSGYLHTLLVEPGTSLPPGSPVLLLADTVEELGAPAPTPLPASRTQAPEKPSERPSPESFGATPPGSRVLASPLARRMARQAGLDLASLPGSGRQGAILKRDVLRLLATRHPGAPAQPLPGERILRLPVSAARKAIAQRTQWSKNQAPHFYASSEIDMVAARELLSQAVDYAQRHSWTPPTINDLVLRATALALRQVPRLNASFQGEEILVYKEINLGLVIGLADGMIVPVLHNVDRKNLYTIAAQTKKLKENALAGRLSNTDLSGGTFTVSNLGMYSLDSFVAVINPPQAGILALGALRQAAVVRENQVVPRWMMTACLSVDHRAVDGVHVATFMQELSTLLENPFSLTLEAPEEEAN